MSLAILKWIALGGVALVVLALIGGRLGAFRGIAPPDLGPGNGRLKPPSMTENSVSSQAGLYPDHPMRTVAWIAPIAFAGDGTAALAKLRGIVESTDRMTVVRVEPLYLHAEAESAWFRFVDDLECLVDENERVIHVRSAARLGRKDFGVNRARVDRLRARFNAQ